MGLQLNTGVTGNPVTAEADGSLYSNVFGSGQYVLASGNQLAADVVSNNEISILDGDIMMQGRHAYIAVNDSESLAISNGTSGYTRIDLIIARYVKDATGLETMTLVVLEGDKVGSANTPSAPAYVEGNILDGDTQVDFPLYEVVIDGISIASVNQLFEVISPLSDMGDAVGELDEKVGAGGVLPSSYYNISEISTKNTFYEETEDAGLCRYVTASGEHLYYTLHRLHVYAYYATAVENGHRVIATLGCTTNARIIRMEAVREGKADATSSSNYVIPASAALRYRPYNGAVSMDNVGGYRVQATVDYIDISEDPVEV